MKKNFKFIVLVLLCLSVFYFNQGKDVGNFDQKFRHRSISSLSDNKKYLKEHQSKLIEKNKLFNESVSQESFENKLSKIKNKMRSRGSITKQNSGSIVFINNQHILNDDNGNSYSPVKGKYALVDDEISQRDYPDAEVRLGYRIIETDFPPSDSLAVLKNSTTGNEAIFTGLIKAKLNDMRELYSLITSVDYSIHLQYEMVSLVMYKFNSFEDALLAKSELDRNSYIDRATIEIIEYQRIEQ